MSMIGRVRFVARYAAPRSLMNAVGECVGRSEPGLSWPCDASAPPITFTSSETSFNASYVRASSSS